MKTEFIDLGLSVRWASCNLGAEKPEDYGDYKTYDEAMDWQESTDGMRLPTNEEWRELIMKCCWEWTEQNGVKGYKVTALNGNCIFLPAAGYRGYSDLYLAGSLGDYWSSSLNTDNPNNAWNVNFNSDNVNRSGDDRYLGLSVRPVTE